MAFVDNKEVVRILAKKFNGKMQPECKKLCVDPQLTSFEILQHLLIKAFDIKTDFAIYYLATDNTGQNVYLSLLSDWDLDAAFFGASNPCLSLKVDLKPFEDDGLDDEWDIVAPYEVNRTSAEVSVSNTLRSFINQKVSRVIQAIGLRQDDNTNFKPQKPPMSDPEFRNFLDAVGHLVQPQQFRLSVYQGGVEPSLRRVVWRHLLNIYPDDMTGRERFDYVAKKTREYYSLREEWRKKDAEGGKDAENIRIVSNMVWKDVLRTDRTHAFYAGTDENKNVEALANLLVTYAVTHPSVGYCQGMSDLASPILVIEKDEAHAYICFCALMRRLETNFSVDGLLMTTKFEHLSLLLQHYDPVFADYLKQENADMFFCYRWILLEMKREFPLDDALYMLEVMWSTLPLNPPKDELLLADPAYFERGVAASSPSVSNLIQLRRRLSTSQSTTTDQVPSTRVNLTHSMPPAERANSDSGGFSPDPHRLRQTMDNRSISLPGGKIDGVSGKHSMKNPPESKPDRQTVLYCRTTPEDIDTIKNAASEPDLKETADVAHAPDNHLKKRFDGSERIERSRDESVSEDDSLMQEIDLGNSEEVDERTNLLDPAFVNISEVEKLVQLPPPMEFGCGNPFLMFLALSLLLQHRDHVMSNRMDYNEIAVFFDRMVRKHDVHAVIHHAKSRYALYLRQQQQLAVDSSDPDLSV